MNEDEARAAFGDRPPDELVGDSEMEIAEPEDEARAVLERDAHDLPHVVGEPRCVREVDRDQVMHLERGVRRRRPRLPGPPRGEARQCDAESDRGEVEPAPEEGSDDDGSRERDPHAAREDRSCGE